MDRTSDTSHLVTKPKSQLNGGCSCTNCNSFDCFELRRNPQAASDRCTCYKCLNLQTCLFYKNPKSTPDTTLTTIYNASDIQNEIKPETKWIEKNDREYDVRIKNYILLCKELMKYEKTKLMLSKNNELSTIPNTESTVKRHCPKSNVNASEVKCICSKRKEPTQCTNTQKEVLYDSPEILCKQKPTEINIDRVFKKKGPEIQQNRHRHHHHHYQKERETKSDYVCSKSKEPHISCIWKTTEVSPETEISKRQDLDNLCNYKQKKIKPMYISPKKIYSEISWNQKEIESSPNFSFNKKESEMTCPQKKRETKSDYVWSKRKDFEVPCKTCKTDKTVNKDNSPDALPEKTPANHEVQGQKDDRKSNKSHSIKKIASADCRNFLTPRHTTERTKIKVCPLFCPICKDFLCEDQNAVRATSKTKVCPKGCPSCLQAATKVSLQKYNTCHQATSKNKTCLNKCPNYSQMLSKTEICRKDCIKCRHSSSKTNVYCTEHLDNQEATSLAKHSEKNDTCVSSQYPKCTNDKQGCPVNKDEFNNVVTDCRAATDSFIQQPSFKFSKTNTNICKDSLSSAVGEHFLKNRVCPSKCDLNKNILLLKCCKDIDTNTCNNEQTNKTEILESFKRKGQQECNHNNKSKIADELTENIRNSTQKLKSRKTDINICCPNLNHKIGFSKIYDIFPTEKIVICPENARETKSNTNKTISSSNLKIQDPQELMALIKECVRLEISNSIKKKIYNAEKNSKSVHCTDSTINQETKPTTNHLEFKVHNHCSPVDYYEKIKSFICQELTDTFSRPKSNGSFSAQSDIEMTKLNNILQKNCQNKNIQGKRSDCREVTMTISGSSLNKERDFGLLAFVKGFIRTEIHNYDGSKIDKHCKSVDCTSLSKSEPNTRQLENEVEKNSSPVSCYKKLKSFVCQELKDTFISKSNVSIISIKSHGEMEVRSSNKISQENVESECLILQKTNILGKSPQFEIQDKSIDELRKGKRKEHRTEKNKENKNFLMKETTPNTYNNSNDEINAQIVNLPFAKIKTITYPETKLNCQNDLLKKIRHIYKACNCKVCECISSGPTKVKSEMCNCKPCDCAECRGESLDHNKRFKKSSLKAMLRSYSDKCQCKPCDCIECNEKNPKSCKCYRCECNTCESLDTKKQTNFIVAQVGENLQRPYCQCSSCGCFECTNPLGTPTHNTQQTGTDIRRHVNCDCNNCINDLCEQEGIDTCSCDRAKKLMRKPVTRDKNDYDIHYFMNKKIPDYKYCLNIYKKQTPVPIYTSLTQHLSYPSNTLTRCCFQIATNSNYAARNVNLSIIPQDYWTLRTQADLMTNSINECNCKPCECLKCRKHFLEGHIPYRYGWSCEICDCINCATLNVFKEIDKEYNHTDELSVSKQKCNCKPCMCEDCTKYIITSMHGDSTMNESALVPPQQQLQKSNSDRILTLLNASDSERFIDLLLSDKETKNIGVIKNKSILFGEQTLSENDNVKRSCANMMKNKYQVYCNEGLTNVNKKIEPLRERNSKLDDSENLGYFTRTESLNLSDEMSFESEHKNKIVSEIPKKSQTGSSCNSSGHDYSDYLIRFPTSTAKSCINDVMSLVYNKPDKVYSKLSLTSIPVKGPLSNSSLNTLKLLKKPSLCDVSPPDTFQQNYTGKNCKNENSEKSCDCSPCDCEKCTYKMPKLKRCRCDCFACKCDGTCLSEDRSVLIRKNETTQTSKSAPDCGEVLIENLSLLNFKMSNITLSGNSAVVNNRIVKWTDCPGNKFGYNSTNVSVKHDFHTVNYDSVRRTIREAKQFSLELLSILQKYEKANKDLDVMTERYRILHAPVLKADNKKIQYLQPNNYLTYIETVPHHRSVMQCVKIPDEIEFEKSTKLEKIYNVNDTEVEKTCISELAFKNTTREQCNKSKNIIQENVEKYRNNASLKSKEICDHVETKQKSPFQIEEFFKHAEQNTSDSFVIENMENTCGRNEWINKGTNSSVTQVSGDNIIVNKITRPSLKFRGFLYQVPQIKELINKNSNSDLNTDVIRQSQKNHGPSHNNELTQHILNREQLDSSNNIIEPVKAEFDAVEVAKESRSTQSSSTRNVKPQEKLIKLNSTNSRLGSERSSGLRSTVGSDTATSIPESIKSGHDRLRVVFQMVRKVSDHSIHIKWKIPEDITGVEGYEILVDDRSIQRILNPNKNMAVLTCLPHADKVKLTVRTMVKSAPGHAPSASVSYCNRAVSSLR